jgi:periplasmic protein TonB
MATRALLLCGDEKAVHVVTQILDELEISFEHSGEPPFALKRLAARRFELLIVDCDNVQNATQVFNSARASNLNKASIAIAIVEGKAGVPSAFRLGASLVLTKPVSLEQARNTLRTGVGMTRKDAQEAKPATPAATVPPVPTTAAIPTAVVSTPIVAPPVPLPAALTPVAPPVAPLAGSPDKAAVPVAASPKALAPVVTAPTPASPLTPKAPAPSAKSSETESSQKPALTVSATEKPVLTPRPVSPAEEHKPALTNFADDRPTPALATGLLSKAAAASTGAAPAETSKFDAVFTGPAIAPEESKSKSSASKTEIGDAEAKTEKKTEKAPEKKAEPTLRIEDPLAEEESVLDPIRDNGVPSFGTANQSFAGLESRSSKKGLLVATAALVLVAGGVYAAWMTQPGFRDIVTYEFGEVSTKVGAMRGRPQPEAVAAPEAEPAPPAPVQTSQTLPPPPADANTVPDATPSAASASSNPALTTSTVPTSAAVNPSPAATAVVTSNSQKSPSAPTAKQENSAHATPSSVAAGGSAAPSANAVTKSSVSDLVEVPEEFADDQVIHRVHPTYPKQARAKKLSGSVVLQAVISKQGKVDSLQLVSGDPQLAQAAAEAVKQWRYKPYSRNGEPTDFQTKVTVDFKAP